MKEANTTAPVQDVEDLEEEEDLEKVKYHWIEVPPQEDWFHEVRGQEDQVLVYVRVRVTGLKARLVGPFSDRQTAMWALDRFHHHTIDGWCDYSNRMQDHVVEIPFHNRPESLFVEHPDVFHKA